MTNSLNYGRTDVGITEWVGREIQQMEDTRKKHQRQAVEKTLRDQRREVALSGFWQLRSVFETMPDNLFHPSLKDTVIHRRHPRLGAATYGIQSYYNIEGSKSVYAYLNLGLADCAVLATVHGKREGALNYDTFNVDTQVIREGADYKSIGEFSCKAGETACNALIMVAGMVVQDNSQRNLR